MSNDGRSFAGAFALAKQSGKGTPNGTPQAWLPVTSEGVRQGRSRIQRQGVFSSPEVQCHSSGLKTNSGPFAYEADGIALGYCLQGVLGAPVSAAKAGKPAAPTPTGGTAGAIVDGVYSYRLAMIFEETATGELFVGGASDASSTVTLSGGTNGSVALAWTNPSPPSGHTLHSAVLYRKKDTGAFQKLVVLPDDGGVPESYSDLGAVTPGTEIPAENPTVHTYTPAIVVANMDLPYFTALRQLDVAKAIQVQDAKIASMALNVQEDGDSPVTCEFQFQGGKATKVDNQSPAFTPICAMMSHQSRISQNGSQLVVAKAMSLNINNNITAVYYKNGQAYPTKQIEGNRQVTGSLTLGAENLDQWDLLDEGLEFSLTNEIFGEPTTASANIRIDANTLAKPFPYAASFHLPKCLYDGEIGAALDNNSLMNESPNFGARFSADDGYTVQATVTNMTASYS